MMTWLKRSPPQVKLSFFAMGTDISVTIALVRQSGSREKALEAIGEIEQRMQAFGRDWWPWSDGGALSRINRSLEQGEVADIPPEMRPLFANAWAVRQATNGIYEPRIAKLVQLWGFHDLAADPQTPPKAKEVTRLRNCIGHAPDYDGGFHYGPAVGIGWDFGGIAKGWIVDEALDLLMSRGFENAIVDAGGNLAVRGLRGGQAWRIGIRAPDSDPAAPELVGTMSAQDESINTHGDDQRFFLHNGRRYSHLLDPSTGEPARGIRSVTVVHRDGYLAEAGGAALYVAGPERWPALAHKLKLTQVLVVRDDASVEVTKALSVRVKLKQSVQVHVVD